MPCSPARLHTMEEAVASVLSTAHIWGGHWITCLTLLGSTTLPRLIDPYKNHGNELESAHRLLKKIPPVLKNHAPDLYLLDSLYFTTNIFSEIVHELGAHLVIKSKKPVFRTVLKSADQYFDCYTQETHAASAFDCQCKCQYTIYATEEIFADIPIRIIKVCETYVKKSKNKDTECYSEIVHELGAHLVIKSKKPVFRTVLKSADQYFDCYTQETHAASAFDCQCKCQYTIYATEEIFADIPIRIIKVCETYVKKSKNKDTECYMVTTDMSMSAEEIREAGHLRWDTLNNVFKRLNHHCGTKTERVKDSDAFVNWLYLVCLGTALFGLLKCILKENKGVLKEILDGRKETWRNLQSAFKEHTNMYSILLS